MRLYGEEDFPLLTKIVDDTICSSVVKCTERHVMAGNTRALVQERWWSRALEVFQIDPETVRRCSVAHIAGTAACGFPFIKLLTDAQPAVKWRRDFVFLCKFEQHGHLCRESSLSRRD